MSKHRNIKLLLAFDGTNYAGWQKQKTAKTIQGVIEEKIQVMTGENASLHGSGRTDAGVHAYGQVANFLCETKHTPEVFLNGLNSLLPEDIVLQRDGKPVVFIAASETVSARTVKIGFSYRGKVLISEGLNPGDKIVVTGQEPLQDGDRIRIR